MTMQPPKRLPHQRRLGAIATGLALAGAMLAPGVAQAFGFPPFSFPDTISTNEDTATTGNVLDNDFNFNTTPMTVSGYTPLSPTNGVLVIAANGDYSFTPAPNWHGTTTTSYTAVNDDGDDTATITITVASVNDAPVANDDTVTATEDTTTGNVSATIRGNDTDVDGDTLTISAVSGSTGGTATRTGGGATVTFAPNANLCGPGAGGFDYTISDGHGGTDSGHVTVNITCVNDNPVANDDTLDLTEDQPADVTAAILANDTDIDLDTLVVSDTANGVGGTVILDAGAVTFSPTANLCGPGVGGFDYTANDGAGGTSTAHVGVNVACVNDAPVATDDAATTNEDTQLVVSAFDMVGNDSDVEFDGLTVTAIDNVTGGIASLDAGDVTFDPTANLCGPGAGGFDYTVDDGNGGTDTGHVTIDITCVNDNPSAGDDTVTATEDTDLATDAADLLANDSDVDGDELSLTAVHDASGGTVALDDTTVTFSPAANLCGPAAGSFEYDISDGHGGSFTGSVTVDITCVNDDPVAADDTVSGTEDEPLTVTEFDMLNNDDDIDSGALTLAGVSNVTGGSAEVDGVDVDFTPDADNCGPGAAGYDYTVEDGDGGSAVAHVTIDLTCVNDDPTAVDDTVIVAEDSVDNDVTDDILDNDSDIDDGDTVHVSDVSNATRRLGRPRRRDRHLHARRRRLRRRLRQLRLRDQRRQRRHGQRPRRR